MKEITLTKEQYESLPYKSTKLNKDQTFGDLVGLLRRRGIKKYFMDEESETLSFEYRVKLKDMEKSFLVKLSVPHLMVYKKTNPKSRYSEQTLVYLENESWRMLWWYMKNKLDAIQYGIVDDLREFIPNIYYSLGQGMREVNLADAIIENADQLAKLKQLPDDTKPTVIEAEFEVKEEKQ